MIESNEGVLKWIEDSEVFNLNLWEEAKIFSGKIVYEKGKLVDDNVIFYD